MDEILNLIESVSEGFRSYFYQSFVAVVVCKYCVLSDQFNRGNLGIILIIIK